MLSIALNAGALVINDPTTKDAVSSGEFLIFLKDMKEVDTAKAEADRKERIDKDARAAEERAQLNAAAVAEREKMRKEAADERNQLLLQLNADVSVNLVCLLLLSLLFFQDQ